MAEMAVGGLPAFEQSRGIAAIDHHQRITDLSGMLTHLPFVAVAANGRRAKRGFMIAIFSSPLRCLAFVPVLGALLLKPEPASAETAPSLSCSFNSFIQLKQGQKAVVEQVSITQTMAIIHGETAPSTLALDGTKRAANSRHWEEISAHGWETFETQFLGDFREILSLRHQLGANLKPLKGTYPAALSNTGVEETHVSLGSCTVE